MIALLAAWVLLTGLALVVLQREFTRLRWVALARAVARHRARLRALEEAAAAARAAADAARAARWAAMTPEERHAENMRLYRIETMISMSILSPRHAVIFTNPA